MTIKRWWIDSRAHTAPRAQGVTNRYTAWSVKPDLRKIAGPLAIEAMNRLTEVMPVSEHEARIAELTKNVKAEYAKYDERIASLESELEEKIQG